MNDKVLYRDNVDGEPNQWIDDQDANNKKLLNLPDAVTAGEPLTLRQYQAGAVGQQTIGINKLKTVAVDGQILFTAPSYVPSSNNLSVYVNGVRQDADSYSETSDSSITFSEALAEGDIVEMIVNEYPELEGQTSASSVLYNGTNVQDRLEQTPYYFATVAEMQDPSVNYLKAGDIVIIGERANGLFDVGSYTANGYEILEATVSGLQVKLRVGDVLYANYFGADPSASATFNSGAIQRAIDYIGTSFTLLFKEGTYQIDDSLSIGFGAKIFLGGANIQQTTSDIPAFIVTSSRWEIKGGTISYATAQSTSQTKSYGILLDAAFEGSLDNLLIQDAYRGVGVNDQTLFDGSSFCYMVSMKLVRTLDCSDWGFYLQNDGSTGMTTNFLHNCYALQSSNSNANTSSKGFYIGTHTAGCTLIGCASDKLQDQAVLISASTNVKLIGFDIESCDVTDTNVVDISSSTNTTIDGIVFDANTFNGTTCALVRVSGTSRNATIKGREKSSTDNAVNTYGLQTTSTSEDCVVHAYDFISDSSFSRSDGLTPNGKRQIYSYNFDVYAELMGIDKHLEYRTSAPTSGTWEAGDRVKNSSISNANPIDEWACIVSGTPGSWRPVSFVTVKGATGSRPTLAAGDFGVQYLDTTLNANGQPIWWNGSAWVDSTGATV